MESFSLLEFVPYYSIRLLISRKTFHQWKFNGSHCIYTYGCSTHIVCTQNNGNAHYRKSFHKLILPQESLPGSFYGTGSVYTFNKFFRKPHDKDTYISTQYTSQLACVRTSERQTFFRDNMICFNTFLVRASKQNSLPATFRNVYYRFVRIWLTQPCRLNMVSQLLRETLLLLDPTRTQDNVGKIILSVVWAFI